MILWFFTIILICYVLYLNITKTFQNNEESSTSLIEDYKRSILPYSGLNPDLFYSFSNNLDLFQKNVEHTDLGSKYLYQAADDLFNLQLEDPDFDFTDEIYKILIPCEKMLLQMALKYGNLFIPKYLNK